MDEGRASRKETWPTTVIEPRSASPGPGKRIANHKQGKNSRVASEFPPVSLDSQRDLFLFGGVAYQSLLERHRNKV